MVGRVASSMFSTGPNDVLAAVDIYKKATGDVVNSFQDVSAKVADTRSILSFQGGKALIQQAGKLAQAAQIAKYAVSSKDALTRIAGVSTAITSAARTLSNGNDLLGKATEAIRGGASMAVKVGAVVNSVKHGNYGDILTMGAVLDNLPGVSSGNAISCFDTRGQVAALGSLVNEAARIGVPNSFSKVIQYTSLVENPQKMSALTQLAKNTLPDTIRYGDWESIKTMGTVLPTGTLKTINPNIIADMGRSYTLPAGVRTGDLVERSDAIRSTYTAVDANWNRATRQGSGSTSLVSLAGLRDVSSDLSKVLRSGAMASSDPLRKIEILANVIPKLSVTERIAKNFPQSVFGNKTEEIPQDPRLRGLIRDRQTELLESVVLI